MTATNQTAEEQGRENTRPITKKRKVVVGERRGYSFAEFAAMAGRERTWTYRQVEKGRIKAITGFGEAMIPASEVERIFGGREAK